MEKSFSIEYRYTFNNGSVKTFLLTLERSSLALMMPTRRQLPPWTLLNHKKCANCPLDPNKHAYCPVASNFVEIAAQFQDLISHEDVQVTVTTEDRVYAKNTTVQHGLSPLVGIIMTTSGCPIMEHLKPMVRFHLPFASIEETVFRMVSLYLLLQYFRRREGMRAEWTLDGLTRIYAEVSVVNRDFAGRLRDAAEKDANINALVNLDVFAAMVPLVADETLESIRPYFSAYFGKK